MSLWTGIGIGVGVGEIGVELDAATFSAISSLAAAGALGGTSSLAASMSLSSTGRLWVPSDLASCVAYGDASDLALADGANVSAWGTLQSFTASSNFPTFEATGYNGKPSVKFNGTTQFLTGPAAAAIGNGNSAAFSLVIAFQEITEAVGAFFSSGRTSTTASIYRVGRTGAVVWGSVATNDAGTTNTGFGSQTPDTNRHVISIVCTGGGAATVSQWIDDVLDVNAASFVLGQTTLNEATLGCANTNGSQSLFANIRIRKWALFNTASSTANRQMTQFWANL